MAGFVLRLIATRLIVLKCNQVLPPLHSKCTCLITSQSPQYHWTDCQYLSYHKHYHSIISSLFTIFLVAGIERNIQPISRTPHLTPQLQAWVNQFAIFTNMGLINLAITQLTCQPIRYKSIRANLLCVAAVNILLQ